VRYYLKTRGKKHSQPERERGRLAEERGALQALQVWNRNCGNASKAKLLRGTVVNAFQKSGAAEWELPRRKRKPEARRRKTGAWPAPESASVISGAFNKVKQISERFSSSSEFEMHRENSALLWYNICIT